MKIYIDGLFYRASGIGRYYESITKELAKRRIEIITTVPVKYKKEFYNDFSEISSIKPIFVNYEKFSIKSLLFHSLLLANLKKAVDIFFFPHINLPFYVPPITLVTIHDLIPLTAYWHRGGFKRFLFTYFLKHSINKAKAIVCISKAVRKDLSLYTKEAEMKSFIIYEFPDEKFLKISRDSKNIINEPYILFVGNRKKHKNLDKLLLAFNKIRDDIPHKLVIAGSKDKNIELDHIDELLVKLNLQDRVIQIVSPDDETVASLYKYADLFVFPSIFEGFGLPPLEAVSVGCPSILSNIEILREIFGEAGIYFNPLDPDDIADKIKQALKNASFKAELLIKQRKRLEIFNKEKIIDEYIQLFKKIMD